MKSGLKKITNYIKNNPKVDWILLTVAVVTFLVLSLVNISTASIWFDEAFSAYITRFNYIEIMQFTAQDVHPPLYYWLLKFWSSIFGTTELVFRSLSVLFGLGAVVGGYLLSKKLFGRSVGAVSLLFLTLSPTLIRHSDEARMYTLAAVIAIIATWVLIKVTSLSSGSAADKKRANKWWIAYGAILAIGMWTHYFTALVWLSHWVWRAIATKESKGSKFFSKEWVWSHALAVALFVPWVPYFISQTKHVQSGFWIGPVSAGTPVNYLTNFFYYLGTGDAKSWLALIFSIVVILTISLLPRVYKTLNPKQRKNYLMVVAVSWVSPAILFLLSMPPLSPVFVERYLVPSMTFMSIFFAVVLVVGTKGWKTIYRLIPITLVAVMFIFGIQNVYWYGNYNKNSHVHIQVREAVELARSSSPKGTPIIANSPWSYYEASFYSNPDYPIYFIEEATEYEYGSLAMLRDSDIGKIKDLDSFKAEHPEAWYLGAVSEDGSVTPYQDSWTAEKTVGEYSYLMKKVYHGATLYRFDN